MKLDFNSDETRLMKEALQEFIVNNKDLAFRIISYPEYYCDAKERVAAMQKDDYILHNIVLKLRAGQTGNEKTKRKANEAYQERLIEEAQSLDDKIKKLKESDLLSRMEKYQERVIEEQKELVDKIVKLKKFMIESPKFETLGGIEQADLMDQLYWMHKYSMILAKRIFRFN